MGYRRRRVRLRCTTHAPGLGAVAPQSVPRRGVPFLFKQYGEWVAADGRFRRQDLPHQFVAGDGRPLPSKADCSEGVFSEVLHQRGADLVMRVGKKEAGRLLDGQEHNEFPATAAVVNA